MTIISYLVQIINEKIIDRLYYQVETEKINVYNVIMYVDPKRIMKLSSIQTFQFPN